MKSARRHKHLQDGTRTDDLLMMLEILLSTIQEPSKWQTFLDLLCRFTQCKYGLIISEGRLYYRANGGNSFWSSQLLSSYTQWYLENPTFYERLSRSSSKVLVIDEDIVLSKDIFLREFYRNHLAKRELRYITLVLATSMTHKVETISLWRSSEEGPLSGESDRAIKILMPHIERSISLRNAWSFEQQRAERSKAVADASTVATFLLKKDGQLIYHNAAAARLLRRADSLCIRNGIVSAISDQSSEALHDLYARTQGLSRGQNASIVNAASLERTSGKTAVSLLAVPLSPTTRRSTEADIILVASDPEEPLVHPTTVLASLYGLTLSEGEIVNGLVAGFSLDEIGQLRNVSTGTIRQQLKAIMKKTNTQRQHEIVSLLSRVPILSDTV